MSRIDDLIAQHCPEGVNYKEIDKAVKNISAPKKLNKQDYQEAGEYPVIDQGQKYIVAYTSDESAVLPEDEYVIFGDHTREVKFADFPFAQGADGLRIFQPKNKSLITKFLYYVIKNLDVPSRGYNRHWSIVKVMNIPVPPLPVQQEIVDILDAFTKLEAELEAELEARQQQYTHYRDELLNFDGQEVKQISLGEIYDFQYGTGNTIPQTGGEYPVYGSNGVVGTHHEYNSEDSPVIGHIGAYAGIVNWGKGKHFVTYNGVICRIKSKEVIPQYAYYLLLLQDFRSKANSGSQPFVSYHILNAPIVPVPSIEEQKRIVAILDKFDALVNDISSGLPAEINARRQQYEHYRNKLLTFQEAA